MRRSTPGGLGPGWLGLPAVGVLAYASPLAGAGLTALITAGIVYALAQPLTILAVAGFLVTAIPKAGVNVGGFPLPVMLFLLLATVPALRRLRTPVGRAPGLVAVAALSWLMLRFVLMAFDGGKPVDFFSLAGWYGLPVFLILTGPALGSLRGEAGRRWSSCLEAGVLAACAFSFVQFFLGTERTAVPGVTRAIGADYSRKPLQFAGGSKIPSTYQNGNILGVVTAFFFLVTADRFIRGHGTRRDGLVLAATAGATILSGSRTAVFGLVLGLVVVVVRSKVSPRTLGVCVVLGAAVLGTLIFSPALADRILGTRADDPNIVFRTSGWTNVLHNASTVELLIGDSTWVEDFPDPGQAEGLVGIIQQVGLVGVALLVATVFVATSGPSLRRWRLLLIPVALSVAVDSAYLVFPTLFLPVARMFAPALDEAPTNDRDPDRHDDTIHV